MMSIHSLEYVLYNKIQTFACAVLIVVRINSNYMQIVLNRVQRIFLQCVHIPQVESLMATCISAYDRPFSIALNSAVVVFSSRCLHYVYLTRLLLYTLVVVRREERYFN